MKFLNFGLCALVITLFGAFLVQATPLNDELLGAKRCSWGPTYWCSNLNVARSCKAVRHCIQTVWEKEDVPQDPGEICKLCKDMVGQARDQLRSNETMEEIKEVFEGSCKLLPVKALRKECIKITDNFIPDLVEALSSQMNPDQVCTVAGLCNNARLNEMLLESYKAALSGHMPEESAEEQEVAKVPTPLLTCNRCNHVANAISQKFNNANRDDILEQALRLCGKMSSFSDGCASIVLNYFSEMYDVLKQNLNAASICHMSGTCSAQYHQHAEDKEEEQENLDLAKDDLSCDLCQQLVKHLRDVLIANTTMEEFKMVLTGICGQTKQFKAECLSLVDQYYANIYNTLVNDLDAEGACLILGICSRNVNASELQGYIRPLLPILPPVKIEVSIRKKPLLGANEPKFTQEEIMHMQLPIDHLMGAPNPSQLVEGGAKCTLCEYLLHFIEETLATPATEEEIKQIVTKVCEKLGNGVKSYCHEFIDMYGDAVISLIIQGLNPREVCPKLQLCAAAEELSMDAEVFSPHTIGSDETDKPTCPLCTFAVEEAKAKIKDKKTKQNIQQVLDNLCNSLKHPLQAECIDFVHTYTAELIDMLIADFTTREICVELRLCPKTDNYLNDMKIVADKSSNSEENSASNEISNDDEFSSEIIFKKHSKVSGAACVLCKKLIKSIEHRMGDLPTKEAIVKDLEQTCHKLGALKSECNGFIEKYGNTLAELILMQMEPEILCSEIGACGFFEQDDLEIDEAFKYQVVALPNQKSLDFKSIMTKDPPNCVLCEFVMSKLEADLKNKTTQDEIKHSVEHICSAMPKTIAKSCLQFIDQYAATIISLVGTLPPREICKTMQLCSTIVDMPINDDVIECGVCHGATSALMPYFQQHLDPATITAADMMSVACENLPAKYYQTCSEMMTIYGASLLHLSQRGVSHENNACAAIGKCFAKESSDLAFARISA